MGEPIQLMADCNCTSLEEALLELEQLSPNAPLLALGQTIFWDEPMKAGVALKVRKLGLNRKFVAGVHDSDYFAKIPGGRIGHERFVTLPHNDATTRGLWSAAGEFSTLFGSETVLTREALIAAGVRVDSIVKQRPKFLEDITEAWGWRGIVSLDDSPPITAELPIESLYPELIRAFEWACDSTLDALGGESRTEAVGILKRLRQKMDLAKAESKNLSTFYRKLLPDFYELVANLPLSIETSSTTELLRFNRRTCSLPRFESLGLFVDQATREQAVSCYDDAIKGSAGLYELARFGTGSIPFDMIIPRLGRGTIRLGKRGAVIMTAKKQFLSFRKPLESIEEFASLVEEKFGPDCVVVGKAVSLIGMLGREFIFVFHEGASAYVKHSRKMHQLILERLGRKLEINPVLRVRYASWDALGVCCSWLRLPEVIQRPFGTEELCAPSFASRWKAVASEQRDLIAALSKIRRPIELIRYLDQELGGSWRKLAEEYESLYGRLQELHNHLRELSAQRDKLYIDLRNLKQERVQAELARGDQFRRQIFGLEPTSEAIAERNRLSDTIEEIVARNRKVRQELRKLGSFQHSLTEADEIKRIYERRRAIGLEAELKKARLIRSAVVASKGLANASVRPSAWWFPLVCPDGLWFRETIESAVAYLEPLC